MPTEQPVIEKDSDGIAYVNREDVGGRERAICQCGNNTFKVVFGEWYCGGICEKCGTESELYSG